MYRKITRTGPATHTIALPSKWVKKNNLSAGEEIDIEEKGGELVISLSKKPGSQKSIKFQYKAYLIKEMLEKLYYEKYSEIEIFSEEPLPKNLHDVIKNFPGFEIIDNQDKKILIQRIFTSSGQNLNAILRRTFLIFSDNLENNPPKLDTKIKELLWLLKQENYRLDIVDILLKIYDILKEKKPFYDEAFSLMRNTFNKVYQQNYSFNSNVAKDLSDIFEKQDEMFSYYFKQTKFLEETSKLYSCFELLNQLNKIIIKKKSIEELSLLTEGKEKKQFKIGICLKNQSNEFWASDVVEGMNSILNTFDNIDLAIEFPLTDFDVEGQKKILKNFLLQEVDAIIYAPIDPRESKDILQSINKAKIPLVIIDTDIEIKDINYYYLGFDNYKGGYETGQYLKKQLPKKSCILTLSGHLTGNFTDRIRG
ncbi:MAG: substrate-binding domain-containing protein, partial [Candidatus Nanoarchaeia archaeon]|nr:substrate-binding domain-containing protein [Candidatus Nanoarchaeia archaeon]